MHALVIDDSKAMRTILGSLLNQLGFEVIGAADGREGLDRLRQNAHATLCLVDWNMPEMDGLTFIKAVRAERVFDDLRLVVVSTETERTQMVRALEAGANEYVMKPFTKDVITEKLRMLGLVQ